MMNNEDWEGTVSQIISANDDVADRRWLIGDLVAATFKKHGRGTIKELAKDVGIEYTRLYDYYRAADAFPQSARPNLPNVSLSHCIVLAKYVADVPQRITLLEKVSEEGWTVRKLGYVVGKLNSEHREKRWEVCPTCGRRYRVFLDGNKTEGGENGK